MKHHATAARAPADERTMVQLLRDAAEDIEAALLRMNVRYRTCSGCEARRYENVPQAEAYRRFEATPEKLRAAAARLEAHDMT